jgi:predicted ArsR family transcriptional regulator
VLATLEAGPATAADLAAASGVELRACVDQLSRLVAGGHARVVTRVARLQARRPVAVYGLVFAAAGRSVPALCRAWR